MRLPFKKALFCLVLLFGAFLVPANEVRAVSVAEEYVSRMNANLRERADALGISVGDKNVWQLHTAIWQQGGAPVSGSVGVDMAAFMRRADWFWFVLFTAMFGAHAFQIWNQIHSGTMPYSNMIPVAGKLFCGLLIGARPDIVYATMMTAKDLTSVMIALAFEEDDGPENGTTANSNVLKNTIQRARIMSHDQQQILAVVEQAVIEAYRERGQAIVGGSEPATVQIYNILARKLSTVSGAPEFPVIDQKVRIGDNGSFVNGNNFDGRFTDVSGNGPGSSVPLIVTNPSEEGALPREYSYPYVSDVRDTIRQHIPRMLVYLAMLAPEGALAGTGAYPISDRLRDPNGALMKAYAAYQETLPKIDAIDKSHTLSADRMKASKDDGVRALTRIASAAKMETSTFLDLTFVQQYKNHHDTKVKDYARALASGGLDRPLPIKVTKGGDKSNENGFWAKAFQFIAEFADEVVRKFVVWAADFIFSFLVETYIFVVWIALPFLLAKQTERAFTGALRTLICLLIVPPALTFLLTFSDLAIANFAFMLTNGPSDHQQAVDLQNNPPVAQSWFDTVKYSATSIVSKISDWAKPPIAFVGVALAKIIAPILCLFAAPKVARTFFSGGNVVTATAAPIVGAAAVGAVGAAAVASGGAALGGAAALKMGSLGAKLGPVVGGKIKAGLGRAAAAARGGGGGGGGATASISGGSPAAPVGGGAGINAPLPVGDIRGVSHSANALKGGASRKNGAQNQSSSRSAPPTAVSGHTQSPASNFSSMPTGERGREEERDAAETSSAAPPTGAPIAAPTSHPGTPPTQTQEVVQNAEKNLQQNQSQGRVRRRLSQVGAAMTRQRDGGLTEKIVKASAKNLAVVGVAAIASGGNTSAFLRTAAGIKFAEQINARQRAHKGDTDANVHDLRKEGGDRSTTPENDRN